MKNNFLNRILALTLSAIYISGCVSLFSYANGADTVISDTYRLSDGIVFKSETLVDNNSNTHQSFVIEFTPGTEHSSIEFLHGSNLNTRNTVTHLVSSAENVSGTPVAAMNADFFNMSTGLAESAIIKDGFLLTSDRDNYAFAFDTEGKAFIDKPAITMELLTPYKQYNVLHFNKEFTQYGLYLYSHHYGDKTRINKPSVELILYPYTEMYDYKGMAELLYGVDDVPFDLESTVINEDGTQTVAIDERYKTEIDEYASQNGFIQNGTIFYVPSLPEVTLGAEIKAFVREIRYNDEGQSLDIPKDCFVLAAEKENQSFKFENVVEGDSVSVTFNCNEKFLSVDEVIGCGALIVKDGQVVENTNLSHYLYANPRTAIGITSENKVIMFAVDGRQGSYSKGMTLKALSEQMISLGCVTAANLDGGGSTVVKASLPKTEGFVTVNSPSDKSERAVSNAIGFYNLGEPDTSRAYSYLDSEHRLVLSNSSLELGRAYFVDLSYYPSGVSEIKNNERENIHNEGENFVTDDEVLNELLQRSSAYQVEPETETEEQSLQYEYEGFSYTVAENQGIVQDGKYYPNGYVGDVYIISNSPDGFTNEAVMYKSLGEVDNIIISGDNNSRMYVGDSLDFSARAVYKGFDVVGGDDCFIWQSNDSAIEIDSNGLAVANAAADSVMLTASFGKTTAQIEIVAMDLPFIDISSNWAKSNIIQLYEKGISIGELTHDGRMYFPSRNFTRAEFCVMLSRVLGYTDAVDTVDVLEESEIIADETDLVETFEENQMSDIADAENEIQEDVIQSDETSLSDDNYDSENSSNDDSLLTVAEKIPDYVDFNTIPDWARDAVIKLYNNGYLSGFEHISDEGIIFDGTAFVTRREVIRLIGNLLENAPEDYVVTLSDVTEDDEDYQFIRNALYHGIFTGYLDGTLRADNNLTRAEISAVFIRFEDAIKNK